MIKNTQSNELQFAKRSYINYNLLGVNNYE